VEEILDIEIFSRMNLLFREKQKVQDELIKNDDFEYSILDTKIGDKKKHIEEISSLNLETIDQKEKEVKKSYVDIENYEEDVRQVKLEITTLQKEILDQTKVNTKHKKLHTMEAKIENTCKKHKKDLKFFETHNDCPMCQQDIDKEYKKLMIQKKKDKIDEIDVGMKQLDKEIKTVEKRLEKINDTMVLIREKELLINRYETSINEITKYVDKIIAEIEELKNEKLSTATQTGELNQLQEQLTETELKKQKDKNEKIYIDTARHLCKILVLKRKSLNSTYR